MKLSEAKYYMQKDLYYHIDGGFEVEVIAVDGTTYHIREVESGDEHVIGEDEFVSTFQQKVAEAKYVGKKYTSKEILAKYNELIEEGALSRSKDQDTRMYECDFSGAFGGDTANTVWGTVSVDNNSFGSTSHDIRTEDDAVKKVAEYMNENHAPLDEITRVQERYYGWDVTVLASGPL